MKKSYRSHGNMMITGEYLALHGATVLAVPLKYGHEVMIDEIQHSFLYWRTLYEDNLVFHAIFDTSNFDILETSDSNRAEWLQNVLRTVRNHKQAFVNGFGAEVTVKLDMPAEFGWGSDTSLIANLAAWAKVNPFIINQASGGGSGYDIATATNDCPILYTNKGFNPDIIKLPYKPAFSRNIWFIFQENRQQSGDPIGLFRKKKIEDSHIKEITRISRRWPESEDINEIMDLMQEHERIVSGILDKRPIGEDFNDFDGAIKSLGAWGGKYFLAVSKMSGADVISYFEERKYSVFFNWDELVL